MTMFKEILKASHNNQASIFAFTFKFKISYRVKYTRYNITLKTVVKLKKMSVDIPKFYISVRIT